MTLFRHAHPRQSRSSILWCLGFFLLTQLGMTLSIELWRPSWSDPEFGYRVVRLRRARAANPGRPLVLVFGSSRVGNGFASDEITADASNPAAPLFFNMSAAGGGPSGQLRYLRRMIAMGLVPDEVVFEAWFPVLETEGVTFHSKNSISAHRIRFSDLEVWHRHAPEIYHHRLGQWLEWNCVPWYSNRFTLIGRYLPELQNEKQSQESILWRQLLSPMGWIPIPIDKVPPDSYQQALAATQQNYQSSLAFEQLHPITDAIFRDMMDLCREHRIKVVTFLAMPEETVMRNWYNPASKSLARRYFTDLAREYGTHFVDASDWVPDGGFLDGHHLLGDPARRFTRRFHDTVYLPIQAGKDLPTLIE